MSSTTCMDCGSVDGIHGSGCAVHEREPVLNKAAMLKLMAINLDDWPRDCDECERAEPTGWGWQWMDQAPDCEFVLGVPGHEGAEWTICEWEWREARWQAGEERIERIAQSDASGDHYPPACADGLPCGVAHSPGDDAYCLRCTHEPKGGDTVVRDFFDAEMVKQARYQDSRGGDWIDECARTFTPEEFRGAMRFTVGKYLRRVGKKDAELQEVRKMRDYCQRWEAYLVAKEDDQ